jgi:hypothetical protein
MLYIVPGTEPKVFQDSAVPVIITECESSQDSTPKKVTPFPVFPVADVLFF